jgi:transposase-like protein
VKRVERWRDSGLTLKEYAAEIGVNANTLAGWRWRLRSDEVPAARGAPTAPSFVEIIAPPDAGHAVAATAPAPRAAEPFELILSSGRRVRVPVEFDGRALRRLVDALEAR